LCLFLAAGSLVEGVTLLSGEGRPLPRETPEQTQTRLLILGSLLAASACGWGLARLGDRLAKQQHLAGLVTDLLLFLGVLGLLVSALILLAGWQAPRGVADVYSTIAGCAAMSAPVLLGIGWLLHRREVRVGVTK
jgi:hypothetical protein